MGMDARASAGCDGQDADYGLSDEQLEAWRLRIWALLGLRSPRIGCQKKVGPANGIRMPSNPWLSSPKSSPK